MTAEKITATSHEDWKCLCGNEPWKSGFDFCNQAGESVEPTDASGWNGLYRCNSCGRIVDHTTFNLTLTPGVFCIDVVGKAHGW